MNLSPVLTALNVIPVTDVPPPGAEQELFSALVQEHLALDPMDWTEGEGAAGAGETVAEATAEEVPATGRSEGEKRKQPRGYASADSLIGLFVNRHEVPLAAPQRNGLTAGRTWPGAVVREAIAPDPEVAQTVIPATIARAAASVAPAPVTPAPGAPDGADKVPANDKKTPPMTATIGETLASGWIPANVPRSDRGEEIVISEGVETRESTSGEVGYDDRPQVAQPAADHEQPAEEVPRTIAPTPTVPIPHPATADAIPVDKVEPAKGSTVKNRNTATPADSRQPRSIPGANPRPVLAESKAPVAFALSFRLSELTSEIEDEETVDQEVPDQLLPSAQPEERLAVQTEVEPRWSGDRPVERDAGFEVGKVEMDKFEMDKKALRLTETRAPAAPVPLPHFGQPAEAAAPVVTAPVVTAPAPAAAIAPDRPSTEPRAWHPAAAPTELRPAPDIRSSSAPLEIRIDLPHSASLSLDRSHGTAANEAPHVQLHLREHRGEVTVSVRTADAGLSQSLHERLPELVARLEGQGYETRAADGAARLSTDTGRSVHDSSRSEGSSTGARDGGSASDQPFESREQHNQRQQQREADGETDAPRQTRQHARWLSAWRMNNSSLNHHQETTP